jgi:hypothetical protein
VRLQFINRDILIDLPLGERPSFSETFAVRRAVIDHLEWEGYRLGKTRLKGKNSILHEATPGIDAMSQVPFAADYGAIYYIGLAYDATSISPDLATGYVYQLCV